jgi:hypothetical protein
MGASFLDGPTLSMSCCIGHGCLAGLMIFEENAVCARQPTGAWLPGKPMIL